MIKRLPIVIVAAICAVFACLNAAQAGFGISPPYVKTKKPIFPGAHYEQKITLLRSDAEEELYARVTVDAPEIEDWITIREGYEFPLPANQLQVPMLVVVDVPESAAVGNYHGFINIQIIPRRGVSGGGSGVAIALGARVDIDLEVTDETFLDFLVRQVQIPDIETLGPPWKWPIFERFFYRLNVVMKIENTGNSKVAPSKVQLDIYDLNEREILESHTDESIKKIDPFETNDVKASFPIELEPGEYWGRVKIYRDNEIVHNDRLIFRIFEHGKLPGGTELGIWPWLMMGGLIAAGLIFLAGLVKVRIWRYIYQLLYLITWPLRYLWYWIKRGWRAAKKRFLAWLHRKTADAVNNGPEDYYEEED